jgi:hypothetical protein
MTDGLTKALKIGLEVMKMLDENPDYRKKIIEALESGLK